MLTDKNGSLDLKSNFKYHWSPGTIDFRLILALQRAEKLLFWSSKLLLMSLVTIQDNISCLHVRKLCKAVLVKILQE